MIEETIRLAKAKKFVGEKDLSRVVVDTTVQEKNIAFPTDSKLLHRAIVKLGKQRSITASCCDKRILARRNARRAKRRATPPRDSA